jgi:lipopolysaccharide export system protein LptA
MFRHPTSFVIAAVVLVAPGLAAAQETQVAFAGLQASVGEPVEVTANQLVISREQTQAVFSGDVLVVQGGLRMSADLLTVEYAEADRTRIETLIAEGHVLMSTPAEAAQASRAVYALSTRSLEMTGEVLLTQGGNVMSGQKLTVDLTAGTGRMDGRVKTILQPSGN